MKTITHFLFGLGILFTSFCVISLGDSPVLAVVFLIATFVLAAIYLILMGINFIGITYIILYVGAIAVLFLFVIMMLNLKDKDLIESSSTRSFRLNFKARETGVPGAAAVSLNNGIYSLIIVLLFGYLIYTLTSLSLNFKNLIALEYLGLKDWSYFKITDISATADLARGAESGHWQASPLATPASAGMQPFTEIAYGSIAATEPDLINNIKENDLNGGSVVSHADVALLDLTQIETLGHDLYTYGAVLLISLSIILLLAMFATIIISKPNLTLPDTHLAAVAKAAAVKKNVN